MSDTDEDKATAREDLCRFLAACYYEPTVEFTEERLFDSMVAAAERLDPELAVHTRRLGEAFAAADLQELLVDYSRLFLGPVQALARPYASVWLTGENVVMQDTTMELLRLYEQGGFAIDENFQELPDHVAVELEFLYLLTHQLDQAQGSGDVDIAVLEVGKRQSVCLPLDIAELFVLRAVVAGFAGCAPAIA